MRLPQYTSSRSDRVSTREELFEVLEVLGGLDEPESIEMESACDLLALDADQSSDLFDALSPSEEQLLVEIETFHSLSRKADIVN